MADRKVALIIGNSNYQHFGRLPNGTNDAQDMAAALGNLGFEVSLGLDLTRDDTLRLVQDVKNSLRRDDLALFFYAGHAVQIGSDNIILPVDVEGETQQDLRDQSVSLQSILAGFERNANRNVFILDACRDNPISDNQTTRSVGGISRGLARVTASVGTFIAYSTEPDEVASDGDGRNSPFTKALLGQLKDPMGDIHEIMRQVRREVIEDTGGTQIPWQESSLIDQIFLGDAPKTTVLTDPKPVEPRPIEPQPVPNETPVFPYRVAGTDPNGDAFLALRGAANAGAPLLARMPEGTPLDVLGQDGVWFNVRTEFGLVGWAHSNWIRFVGTATAPQSCDALWHQRNAIFARNGYCFQSARGKRAFSNDGCLKGVPASSIPLTQGEKAEVARLLQQEQLQNCR